MKKNKKYSNSSLLFLDFVLNTLLTIVEIIVGVSSGSVALLADGYRNLTDSILITVSFIAEKLCQRNFHNKSKSRIKAISAIMNALIILGVALSIAFTAFKGLQHPKVIDGTSVILIAALSLLVNGVAAFILKNRRNQINIKAPFTGLLYGAVSGGSVLVSSLASTFLHIVWVDSAAGLFIALILLITGKKLIVSALNSY